MATGVFSTALSNKVACNICGVDDATVVFPAGVAQLNQVVRCNRCGLMYASPRRDADHLEFQSWPEDPNFDMAKERPQRFEKETLQVRDYVNTRALLAKLHPNRGKVVELGSGMGLMLNTLRDEGWDVLGVDPDRNACRHATQRLGIEAIPATLEEAALPDESADVVMMLHVIEHVPDPVATLREIHRILKPGGHLVMETPRYDTLTFKMLGRRERSVSCDGHIYFFTFDSLQKVYEAAGFKTIDRKAVGRSLTLDRLAYNVGVVTRSKTIRNAIAGGSKKLGLQKVNMRINFRDMQRVVVEKV